MLEKYVEIYENEFGQSAYFLHEEFVEATYDNDGWIERDCEDVIHYCGYTEHFVLWLVKQFGVDLKIGGEIG